MPHRISNANVRLSFLCLLEWYVYVWFDPDMSCKSFGTFYTTHYLGVKVVFWACNVLDGMWVSVYCVDGTHSHALDSFVLGNIVNIHSFGLSYNSYGVRATTDRLEDGMRGWEWASVSASSWTERTLWFETCFKLNKTMFQLSLNVYDICACLRLFADNCSPSAWR